MVSQALLTVFWQKLGLGPGVDISSVAKLSLPVLDVGLFQHLDEGCGMAQH